jgi:hypothetical protein
MFSYADAAVLCANPSGSLAVRASTCQAGETRVDPAALGLVGAPGAPGAPGADGVSGWELVRAAGVDVPAGQLRGGFAECPAGKRPLGGGFLVNGPGPWTVFEAEPRFDPQFNENGYAAFIRNDGASLVRIFVSAVCATVK